MQKAKKFFFAVGLLSGAQMAMAEGLYVVGSLGAGMPASSLKTDGDTAATAAGLQSVSSSVANGTLMSGALGYAFNDSFAIEAGYIDSGTMKYTGSAKIPGGAAVTLDGNAKVSGTHIAILGAAPMNDKFSVFAKIGYSMSTVTEEGSVVAAGQSFAIPKTSENRNSVSWGIGAAYKITDQFSVRAGYDNYFKDVSGLSASLVLKF
jgi:opacity protein-like surface antigen